MPQTAAVSPAGVCFVLRGNKNIAATPAISKRDLEGTHMGAILTQEQFDAINKEEVQKFLDGSLAKRITASPLIMREERFTVNIKAGMLDSTLEGDSADTRVVMQGAVDLIFKEDNELVVVDYKTDRVRDISRLKELYAKQLNLYKLAVEEFTDYKVKECIIYSIHLNDYISVDC